MTTLVQHKVGETSATQATVPITVASTTSGNLMVIGACNSGTLTVSGVADNAAGGTSVYTQVSGAQFSGTANDKGDVWWCSSIKGGVTTITITFSASDASIKDGWAMEVSGLSSPVIDSAAGAVSGQSNVGVVDNGATVTTTATDGFVFGLVTTSNSISANPQAGNEFSAGGDIQGLTGNAACSLISTTAAAHQPKWTDGASTYGAATVAFKAGATADIGQATYRQRGGRGPTQGPSMRRMMPQQFPTPALVDTVTPLPQIQALRSRGPGMGPRLRRMVPQRLQDAGATTTTLLPTEGAITIAGVAASITLTVAAVAGAITIAGNAPSVTTLLQGVQGSVVIAGNAASTTSILAPAVGAVVISGSTPTLTQTLVGVTGAMTIGGNAPSTTSILAATEGAVVIGGNVPSIVVSSGLTPTEGAITIAGNAPNLLAALSVSEGAISIGGNVPGLIIPTSASETFSGGYGEFARRFRTRAEEELRTEREQWGILPKAAQIVSAVAIRQADALDLDAEQRLEELERELELAGVQYQAQYLELLNLQRQRLIDAEIRGYFEAQDALNEENARRLLLLLAFL